nr:hypothetical protein [Clostridiales bacterium]
MLRPCINHSAINLNLPVDEQMKMFHDGGFECIDFNIDAFLSGDQIREGTFNDLFRQDIPSILEFFRPHKEALEKYGIEVTQTHAPFPLYVDGRDD